ncbi:MAG: flagellar basal body rod protein FlgC [Phycisphaerae bacterium]
MSVNGVSPVNIAVSGLTAQRRRLDVIANNIANAHTSRGPDGRPYRRQDVLLSSDSKELSGVDIRGVFEDTVADFQQVYQPGHPDADGEGFVLMPNVELPVEMVNMVSAGRAYEANAAVLKRYQELVDATLELLK